MNNIVLHIHEWPCFSSVEEASSREPSKEGHGNRDQETPVVQQVIPEARFVSDSQTLAFTEIIAP